MGFAVLMGSHNADALLSRNAQCPGWKGNFATTSTVGSVSSVLPPQCFTRAIALLSWITTVIMITIVMWILLFFFYFIVLGRNQTGCQPCKLHLDFLQHAPQCQWQRLCCSDYSSSCCLQVLSERCLYAANGAVMRTVALRVRTV